MEKVYRIRSGNSWFIKLGKDGLPFMSSDINEAKVMLHGEADRLAKLIEAAGFMAEIEECV